MQGADVSHPGGALRPLQRLHVQRLGLVEMVEFLVQHGQRGDRRQGRGVVVAEEPRVPVPRLDAQRDRLFQPTSLVRAGKSGRKWVLKPQ